MRHAKAEPFAASDEERRLTAQGESDAVAAGEWLADQGFVADRALVSSAGRTRATWAALADGAGSSAEVELDRSLYAAGPESVLDLIGLTDDDVESLIVIGHNPTIGHLAQMLDDGDGDQAAIDGMAAGFPTCSLAVFAFQGSWSDLGIASATVTGFHVGRGE